MFEHELVVSVPFAAAAVAVENKCFELAVAVVVAVE